MQLFLVTVSKFSPYLHTAILPLPAPPLAPDPVQAKDQQTGVDTHPLENQTALKTTERRNCPATCDPAEETTADQDGR